MGAVETLQLAVAVESGTAQRRRQLRHVHLVERPLLVTTTFIAGEPVGVLAVAAKRLGDDGVHTWVVPEPRNPIIRDDRISPFLEWLHAQVTEDADNGDCSQLLVPSADEVKDLGVIARLYRYQRRDRQPLAPTVIAGALHLNWLVGRSNVPGSAAILVATQELTRIWVPPLSAYECGHLGALVAAIDPPAGMTSVQAARIAEQFPFGPAHDNERLLPAVAAFNRARAGRVEPTVVDSHSAEVERVATSFVAPKLDALERAFVLLASVEEAPSARLRCEGPSLLGASTWTWGYAADRVEFRDWVGRVATGRARVAIRTPRGVQAAQVAAWEVMGQVAEAAEVYEDALAMAAALADGRAWKGSVEKSIPRQGRQHPTVVASHPRLPFAFAPGTVLRWAGDPSRVGLEVVTIERLATGGSRVTFDVVNPDIWRSEVVRTGLPAELVVAEAEIDVKQMPPGIDRTAWA